MRLKLFLLTLVMFLPLSSFTLNADENKNKHEIPLYPVGPNDKEVRGLVQVPVECYYFEMTNAVASIVWSDIGDVTLTVTNCSTGSVWHSSFDSAMEPQTFLAISGESGIYELIYITESGNTYIGNFTIIE